MPTNRKRVARGIVRLQITPAAIEAWRAGDFHGLAAALDVKPHQPHPWPVSMEPLGCDQGAVPVDHLGPLWQPEDWARAQELQRALLEVAGEPGAPGRAGE